MNERAVIAVDWGTTNRRAYALDRDGVVVAEEQDDRGVSAVAPGGFAAEAAGIRARLGDLPMVCAGMVGSVRGWIEVPYRACPADLGGLAAGLHWIDPRTSIVPGLSVMQADRCDVMRGEEVQLLGAVEAGLAPPDALLCQPGTHCKWACMAAGRVATFRSTLTGELFALLRRHGSLADVLTGAVTDGAAFREGVAAARDATLLGDLFGVRADLLLGRRPREDAASYVSGLLIGSDVREQAIGEATAVYVLADPTLGMLYATALAANGARPIAIDSRAAFLAGITSIWTLAHAPQS